MTGATRLEPLDIRRWDLGECCGFIIYVTPYVSGEALGAGPPLYCTNGSLHYDNHGGVARLCKVSRSDQLPREQISLHNIHLELTRTML